MKVLSLFDGIGGAWLALQRLEIEIEKYYRSEIDKYANKVASFRHPDSVNLGDARLVKFFRDIIGDIDLLIGGSPCQGFSFAGKQLNFDDPRSKLFFDFVEILEIYRPTYFLLENVVMKQEYQDIISGYLGVKPVKINSSLVSAQSRKRLYWTNIPGVQQPEDRGILLRDIIYTPEPIRDSLIHSKKAIDYMNRTVKGGRNHWDFGHHSDIRNDKSAAMVANFFKGVPYNVFRDWDVVRKFHPVECERLQTVPDGFTDLSEFGSSVSNTQRYKMLGNGFTIEVIAHILKNMNVCSVGSNV